jgi:hypothetical protein
MILKHWQTSDDIEIKTPKELKEFLVKCNPSMLRNYKAQIEILKPDITIKGIGKDIRLFKNKGEENV